MDLDEAVLSKICGEPKVQDVEGLQKIVQSLKEVWKIKTGKAFPEDPYRQLELSINAVLKSWSSKQATDYRKFSGIPPEMANGTAVIIMRMVFGNLGSTSHVWYSVYKKS